MGLSVSDAGVKRTETTSEYYFKTRRALVDLDAFFDVLTQIMKSKIGINAV